MWIHEEQLDITTTKLKRKEQSTYSMEYTPDSEYIQLLCPAQLGWHQISQSGLSWGNCPQQSRESHSELGIWLDIGWNSIYNREKMYIRDIRRKSWWRYQIKHFPHCWPFVTGIHHSLASQRPVTQSFDVLFDLRLNKQLSKQSRRQWFEMPSPSLSHHCNGNFYSKYHWLSARLQYCQCISKGVTSFLH